MEIGAVRNESSSFTSKNKANKQIKKKKKGKERTSVFYCHGITPEAK